MYSRNYFSLVDFDRKDKKKKNCEAIGLLYRLEEREQGKENMEERERGMELRV